MNYTLIYGPKDGVPELLEPARYLTLKAYRMATANQGIIVLDRYGIEQVVMSVCQEYDIPLLVIGTTSRPHSSVSVRHYERAHFGPEANEEKADQLRRYALMKASSAVIIGDTADCRAMRRDANALNKPAWHNPTLSHGLPHAPSTDWLKAFGHFNNV